MKHDRQGFITWFVRQAMRGRGDPALRRRHASCATSPTSTDVVDAFLRAGARDAAYGQAFNLAATSRSSLLESPQLCRGGRPGGGTGWCPAPTSARRSTSARSMSPMTVSPSSAGGSQGVPSRGPGAHDRLLWGARRPLLDVRRISRRAFSADPRRDRVWRQVASYLERRWAEDAAVLDIGAGYCSFINNVRGGRRLAVDLHSDLERFAASGVETMRLSATDMGPLEDSSFDVVFASNLLEHLTRDEIGAALAEFQRVLRPGGRSSSCSRTTGWRTEGTGTTSRT